MSHFDKRAQNWDEGKNKSNDTAIIAEAIQKRYKLSKEMSVMDFGVGTGLLGFHIAAKVKQVYGVDTSVKMLEKVQEKNTKELFIKTIHQDIVTQPLEEKFDALVSSMTLHHIEDLECFFTTIYDNIHENGFIAIADLELEDGSFHSDNTGVFHYGFEKERLLAIVEKCGFKNATFENINTINKPQKDFGIFLLTASR